METYSDRGMVRAVVSHGLVETRYRRAGHGRPVMVLGFDFGDDDTRVPDALQPMVSRCRVIVPEHASITAFASSSASQSCPFSGWLRGFIEGLGIEGARVVAAAALETALERFLLTHSGEVDRLLVVGATAGDSPVSPPQDRAGVTVWHAPATVSWHAIARFVAADIPLAEDLAAD